MSHATRCAVLIAALLCLRAAPATAQMPADVAEKITALGRVVDPARTAQIYAPLQETEPYAGIRLLRDVKYSADDRNVLDIFVSEIGEGPRPVFIYMHGGSYSRGSKHQPGSAFYDNIPLWAARHGLIGVNLEYRLAPRFPWPAAAEDVGAAIRWLAANIASHGGDPARMYLMGHSAGATHVAGYLSHPEFHRPDGSGLAGAILASGIYVVGRREPTEQQIAYFGADRSLYGERSSLAGLIQSKLPIMIATAQLDLSSFHDQFNELRQAMCVVPRGCVRAVFLPQHSHMSEVYAINTPDTRLTGQILEFIQTGH